MKPQKPDLGLPHKCIDHSMPLASTVNKTPLLLCLLCFLQCQTKQEKILVPKQQTGLFVANLNKPVSLIGEWTYNFPFYSSELVLKEDSTFRFHEQGCLGHGYSEGQWKNRGEEYILTSFDQYKNQKAFAVTNEPVARSKKKRKTKTSKFVLDLSALEQNVQIKFPDTANVYFDNAVFRLVAGALCKFDKTGVKTDSKFTKTTKTIYKQ